MLLPDSIHPDLALDKKIDAIGWTLQDLIIEHHCMKFLREQLWLSMWEAAFRAVERFAWDLRRQEFFASGGPRLVGSSKEPPEAEWVTDLAPPVNDWGVCFGSVQFGVWVPLEFAYRTRPPEEDDRFRDPAARRSLAEKIADLIIVHDLVCEGEEKIHPVAVFSAKDIAGDVSKLKSAVAHCAATRPVKDLTKKGVTKLERFLRDLEAELIRRADATSIAGKVAVPPKKRRRQRTNSNLTGRQLEVVKVVGDCNGNIAEAARRLVRDPKSIRESYEAAKKKLGVKASDLSDYEKQGLWGSGAKPQIQSIPADRRGQYVVEAPHEDADPSE